MHATLDTLRKRPTRRHDPDRLPAKGLSEGQRVHVLHLRRDGTIAEVFGAGTYLVDVDGCAVARQCGRRQLVPLHLATRA